MLERAHTAARWPDTFNDHVHPETARAAVQVLEHLGLQVTIPRGTSVRKRIWSRGESAPWPARCGAPLSRPRWRSAGCW